MCEAIQSAPQEHIPQRIGEVDVLNLGVLEVVPQERGTGCVAEPVVDVPAHKITERS